MKVVVSRQNDPFYPLECTMTQLPLRQQTGKALLAPDKEHRTTDGTDQRLGLTFAHAHRREIPQAGIAAPIPAPCPFNQLPFADKAGGRWGYIRHLATGYYRFVDGGETIGGSLASTAAIQDRFTQLLRHCVIGLGQWPQPLQHDESLYLLGKDTGISRSDQGTEGVTEQDKTGPAGGLSDLVEIIEPVDKNIRGSLVI